jgi:hypothetical protein
VGRGRFASTTGGGFVLFVVPCGPLTIVRPQDLYRPAARRCAWLVFDRGPVVFYYFIDVCIRCNSMYLGFVGVGGVLLKKENSV